MASHYAYQASSVRIATQRVSRGNWKWQLFGWMCEEIDHGDGCKTRDIAYQAGKDRRTRYYAHIKTWRERLQKLKAERTK